MLRSAHDLLISFDRRVFEGAFVKLSFLLFLPPAWVYSCTCSLVFQLECSKTPSSLSTIPKVSMFGARCLPLIALGACITLIIYNFSEHYHPLSNASREVEVPTPIAFVPSPSIPIVTQSKPKNYTTLISTKLNTGNISEIFILGMHHTGTSFASGMIALAGSYLSSKANITADVITAVEKLQNGSTNAKLKHHVVYEDRWLQETNDILLASENATWFWICDPIRKTSSASNQASIFGTVERLRRNFTRWESGVLSQAAAASADVTVIKDPRSSITMAAIENVLDPRVSI